MPKRVSLPSMLPPMLPSPAAMSTRAVLCQLGSARLFACADNAQCDDQQDKHGKEDGDAPPFILDIAPKGEAEGRGN